MATQFYRKPNDKNLYENGSNRIISATEFGKGAGFQELKAPAGSVAISGAKYNTAEAQKEAFDKITPVGNTLFGIPKVASSADLTSGFSGTNTPPNPVAPTVQRLFTDNANMFTEQVQQRNQVELDRLNKIQAEQQAKELELAKLKTEQKDANLEGQYDELTTPFRENLVKEGRDKFELDSLIPKRTEMVNSIVEYSQLLNAELDKEASVPGLARVRQGSLNNVKDTYISRVSVAQAAIQAIDGNFSLAENYINQGANAIIDDRNDRINYLNFVKSAFDTEETELKDDLSLLKTDEKTKINELIKTYDDEIIKINEQKDYVIGLMSSPETAEIVYKAGVNITDSKEDVAKKISKYYADNPTAKPLTELEIYRGKKKIDSEFDTEGGVKWGVVGTDKDGNSIYGFIDSNSKIVTPFNVGNTSGVEGAAIPPVGAVGGQCGDYLHSIMEGTVKFGDMFEQKKTIINVGKKDYAPAVGDILIFETGMPYGHVAAIKSINGDKVTVTESNFGLDQRVGERTISLSDLEKQKFAGAYRGAQFKQSKVVDQVATDWAEAIRDNRAKLSDLTGDPDLKNRVIAVQKTLPPSPKAISEAEKMIKELESLRDHKGLNSVVGPNFLARMAVVDKLGNQQDFLGQANKLVSQKALDKLVESKQDGATFGALSEKEMAILRSASTALGTWEVPGDKGVKGYDVSEVKFKEEIQKMIDDYKELIGEATTLSSLEETLKANPDLINEYNTLVADNPDLTDEEIQQLLNN